MSHLDAQKKRVTIVLKELKTLFPKAQTDLLFDTPLELLIAVMLSAQCTDKKVNEVTRTLFATYPTAAAYAAAPQEELERAIQPINYYKNKATYLSQIAKKSQEHYDGGIPQTLDELMALPGVGRKTAIVVLGNAFGIIPGIAVDTHVIRLSQKFGLTTHTTPKKIEEDLQLLLPQTEWFSFTNRMILYGRAYSPAHKRHDHTDPISRALAAHHS